MDKVTANNERRFLATLQKLLEIPAANLSTALTHAADALAQALGADKVDAFLYDETRHSMVALGVSVQPLSDLQRRLGLDVLPLSNGGRVAYVYQTGETFRTGDVQGDPEELRGVKDGLKVRSHLGVPLEVAGQRRGVLMIASLQPDFFSDDDVAFVRIAVRWVAIVAERSELVENIERNALEKGRRTRAEEIIAVLAHDLRNYVSPVALRLYSLRARAEMDNRIADVNDTNLALRAVSGLSALLSDLLDAARLDEGAFQIRQQPIDVAALVREAASTLSTVEHEVIVKAWVPVVVAADETRIRQCLDNVLSNAIAHSPRHAPVSVFVSEERRDGGTWARIEIIDEGPGIPDTLLPHIFERFFSGRDERKGIGLGLYIAKRIANAHGGDISADQYPGKGARFVITIPAIAADVPA